MEDSDTISHRDKYSFISLYLFILIFFVIIHEIIEQSTDSDKVNRFINKLSTYKNEQSSGHIQDKSAIYYSKQIDAYLPAEASKIRVLDATNSKKFAWKEVFENENLKESFKEKVNGVINYVKDSEKDSQITFLISSSDQNKLISGMALIADYVGQINNVHMTLELEKPQSEDLVRILVLNK